LIRVMPSLSWIEEEDFEGSLLKNGSQVNGVNVVFSKNDPFQLINEETDALLRLCMFAWDGNSFPGNEYWMGKLSSTGDSAAACCSQIPELLNPHINKKAMSAQNLHVAAPRKGIVHILDYAKSICVDGEE